MLSAATRKIVLALCLLTLLLMISAATVSAAVEFYDVKTTTVSNVMKTRHDALK